MDKDTNRLHQQRLEETQQGLPQQSVSQIGNTDHANSASSTGSPQRPIGPAQSTRPNICDQNLLLPQQNVSQQRPALNLAQFQSPQFSYMRPTNASIMNSNVPMSGVQNRLTSESYPYSPILHDPKPTAGVGRGRLRSGEPTQHAVNNSISPGQYPRQTTGSGDGCGRGTNLGNQYGAPSRPPDQRQTSGSGDGRGRTSSGHERGANSGVGSCHSGGPPSYSSASTASVHELHHNQGRHIDLIDLGIILPGQTNNPSDLMDLHTNQTGGERSSDPDKAAGGGNILQQQAQLGDHGPMDIDVPQASGDSSQMDTEAAELDDAILVSPSTINRSDGGRCLHFVVVTPPSWKMDKGATLAVIFGHQKLGDWKSPGCVLQKLEKSPGDDAVYVGKVGIPIDVRFTEYKYAAIKKTKKFDYEILHFVRNWYYDQQNQNRILQIPEDCDGDWYQVDGCCHPEKIDQRWLPRRMIDRVTGYQESIQDLLMKDYERSWHMLIPRLENGVFVWYDLELDTKSKDKNVQIDHCRASEIMASIFRTYSTVFDVRSSKLNSKNFETKLASYLNVLMEAAEKMPAPEKLSVAITILNSIYQHSPQLPLDEKVLIRLSGLFGVLQSIPNLQLEEILGDWVTNGRVKLSAMVGWLAYSVNYHLSALPCIALCITSSTPAANVADIRDERWWLPNQLISPNKSMRFPAWSGDFLPVLRFLEQNRDQLNMTPGFIGAILRIYVRIPFDVCRLIDRIPQCGLDHIFAWCDLYLWHHANMDCAIAKYGREISELFDHLTATVASLQEPSPIWMEFDGHPPQIAKLIGSIIHSIGVTLKRDGVTTPILLSILQLVSAVECRLEAFNHRSPDLLFDYFAPFLEACRGCHLKPHTPNTADEAKKDLLECVNIEITGQRTRKTWIDYCKAVFDRWSQDDAKVSQAAIVQVCGSKEMPSIDAVLQAHLIGLAASIFKNRLIAAPDKRGAFTRMNPWLSDGPAYGHMMSLVVIGCAPKMAPDSNDWAQELDTILKWSFSEVFLDKNLLDCDKLNEQASQILRNYTDSVQRMWSACQIGSININMVAFLTANQERFSKIATLIGCANVDQSMDNLKSVIKEYRSLIDQMKVLRKFLSPAEKFHDVAEFSALIEASDRPQSVSEICDKDPSGKFYLKFKLPPESIQVATQLSSLCDNRLFSYIWSSNLDELTAQISIDQVPSTMMEPTERQVRKVLDDLRTLSMTFDGVDRYSRYMDMETIKELCEKFELGNGDWIRESFTRIDIYQKLKNCALTLDDMKRVSRQLDLVQCVNDLEKITVARQTADRLSEVNEKLLRSVTQISKLTDKQMELLSVISDAMPFFTWVRDYNDINEFDKLLSTLLPNVGESDHEMELIKISETVVSVCQQLIFGLSQKSRLNDFLDALKLVWEALENNRLFIAMMRQMCTDWNKLKELEQKSLHMEKSSISEAERINKYGIIKIGCDDVSGSDKIVDDWLCIEVPENINANPLKYITLSASELRDLHSRLTLIGTQVEAKSALKKEINEFASFYKEALRLAAVCQQHYLAGNVLLSNWNCCFYLKKSNDQIYAEANLGSGLSLWCECETDEAPIIEEIRQLSHILESALEDWRNYVRSARSEYPCLNLYTDSQLEFLRRRLAAAVDGPLDVESRMMLMAVMPDVHKQDVTDAIMQFEREEFNAQAPNQRSAIGEDDKREDFLRQIQSYGLSRKVAELAAEHVNYADLDDAIQWVSEQGDLNNLDHDAFGQMFDSQSASFQDQLMRQATQIASDHSGLLATKVQEICRIFVKLHEKQNFHEFISLKNLGYILNALHQTCPATPTRLANQMLNILKNNEPNLLLTSEIEIYRLIISIYSSTGRFPNFDEVLVCRETTTTGEIKLFVERLYHDTDKYIYSIVDVQNLDREAAKQLERSVNDITHRINQSFHLLIFGARENFEKCPASDGLLRFQRAFENPNSRVQSRQLIVNKMADNDTSNKWDKIDPHDMAELFKVNVITSIGYAHGKSLCVQRQYQSLIDKDKDIAYVKIPLHNVAVDVDKLYEMFKKSPECDEGRFFHLDILNHQTKGVDTLLFQLFILGGFTTSNGRVWRVQKNDTYVIEITSAPNGWLSPEPGVDVPSTLPLRFLFPLVLCHSPTSSLINCTDQSRLKCSQMVHQYSDSNWLFSDKSQRVFWYLSGRYEKIDCNFDAIKHVETNDTTILRMFLSSCGIPDPSWFELVNYVSFLNEQLLCCEESIFVHQTDLFPGFRKFVVKFMTFMARDFATRSLEIAEDVSNLHQERFGQLDAYKQKHRWEHEFHPYMFFNQDGQSMSFLGCRFNHKGDLIDANSGRAYVDGIGLANQVLVTNLLHNKVPLTESFDEMKCAYCKTGANVQQNRYCDGCRKLKLQILCRVLGVDDGTDPDPNYEITADCAMKLLAIHMRLKCGIPVVLMGETGCGKTRLIQFLCELQRFGKPEYHNLVLLRMHGGITKRRIEAAVTEALELAKRNKQQFGLPTYLFFDEANTTPNINFVKEVICDDSMNGVKLNSRQHDLCIVAAVNPYRKHDDEMIKRFESSGLGYHVGSSHVQQTFGTIPLRHLVYRVEPLAPSLIPFVIDFGTLTNDTESMYIKRMFDRFIQQLIRFNPRSRRDPKTEDIACNLLAKMQAWMKDQKDETSFVSLRNIDRTLKVAEWFLRHSDLLLAQMKNKKILDIPDLIRAILLSICVCYRASLSSEKRLQFDNHLMRVLKSASSRDRKGNSLIEMEIDACQNIFLDGIQLHDNIAKNAALKENLFLMTLCIELRIPLFLIGRPGSSKSLARAIIEENMRGPRSVSPVFQRLKVARFFSFQCSPLAQAEDIEKVFRRGAIHQKDKDLTKEVVVVVADEVGLAEDTLALKSLHGLLEEGIQIDNEPLTAYHKTGFIGISNWALDPAKMNRAIFVLISIPDRDQLIRTAIVICNLDSNPDQRIESLISPLVRAYIRVYEKRREAGLEFFGLRDFYCLMKMVYDSAQKHRRRKDIEGHVAPLPIDEVIRAIRRNFSGQQDDSAFVIFMSELVTVLASQEVKFIKPSDLIMENLLGLPSAERLNRYVLVLTQNDAAFQAIRQTDLLKNAVIIFGSAFPKDIEYTQVCKYINKIKVCMDRGSTVILLNLDSLYESLYDLLNQAFIRFGGKDFVDLGLGTHRLKCHVEKNFRLLVVVERGEAIKKFPAPLINRLEKHFLTLKSELNSEELEVVKSLERWVPDFISSNGTECVSPQNAFIGYNVDTLAALVLDASQKSRARGDQWSSEVIQRAVQFKLVQCATPESVLRLHSTDLRKDAEFWQNIYFRTQAHRSFKEYFLRFIRDRQSTDQLIQVTTHSRLLARDDIESITRDTSIQMDQIHLFNLRQYGTEQEFLDDLKRVHDISVENGTIQYVIIQCAYQESHAALISGCCYHLEKFLSDFPDLRVQTFLICSLPRKKTGCFNGFRTGVWECVHIDQIVDLAEEEAGVDLLDMVNKSISDLFKEYMEFKLGHSERCTFNFDSLLVECLHLAAAMIRDVSTRKLERRSLLINFWNPSEGGGPFSSLLCHHLLMLLQQMDQVRADDQINVGGWMLREVGNIISIFANSTFMQAIRKRMEADIAPLLAGIISLIDVGNNLGHLYDSDSEWVQPLWFQFFSNASFLDLQYKRELKSNLYFEMDGDGLMLARNEFAIDQSPPVKTPFYTILAKKILNAFHSMHSAWENLDIGAKVRRIDACLRESTDWYQHLDGIAEAPGFLDHYIIDIIQQNYPNTNEIMIELIKNWLLRQLENQEYYPLIIGAQFASKSLADRINGAIGLAGLAQEVGLLKSSQEMSEQELAILGNMNYQLDVYFAKRLCDYLESQIIQLDAAAGVTKLRKDERASWLTLALRIGSVIAKVLPFSDHANGAGNLKNIWFCIDFCRCYLEHVQRFDFLFKVEPIWNLAKRNPDGLNRLKFWERLESNLVLINRPMVQYYERLRSQSDMKTKSALMMFVLDIVYETFSSRQGDPNCTADSEVVQHLLRYITPDEGALRVPFYAVGDGQQDRAIAIRSFILQIMCCFNMQAAITHIDTCIDRYLSSKPNGKTPISFAITCINAIEDYLNISLANDKMKADANRVESILIMLESVRRDAAQFWQRALRNDRTTAADYLTLAKIRHILSNFAGLVQKRCQGLLDESGAWHELTSQVRRLITESNYPPAKLLLMKFLCRHYGRNVLQYCANEKDTLGWIVETDMLKKSSDSFMIYGPGYSAVKQALHEALFYKDAGRFNSKLAEAKDIHHSRVPLLLTCAMHQLQRQVRTETAVMDTIAPSNFDRNVPLRPLLLHLRNAIDGDTASFVWHTISVLTCLPNSGLTEFFKQLLLNPRACKELLFPTMDDDWRLTYNVNGDQRFWSCPNGHPYVIENCGRPWTIANCGMCGALIGGGGHVPVAGNVEPTVEPIRYGHILGPAATLIATGQRRLTKTDVLIIRCLLHASMIGGSLMHGQQINELILPRVNGGDVFQFLRQHLERDLATLTHSLACNHDDVILFMHRILQQWTESQDAMIGKFELRSAEQRQVWEDAFVRILLKPILQNHQQLVAGARKLINETDGEPFWTLIFEDINAGDQDANRLWYYRPLCDLQSLVDQALNRLQSCNPANAEKMQLLNVFLTNMNRISAIRHLLDIRDLHQRLFAHFHGCISLRVAQNTSIAQFLESLNGNSSAEFNRLINAFFNALFAIILPEKRVQLMQKCDGDYRRFPLLYILPLPKEMGSYSIDLLWALTSLQNDLVDASGRDESGSNDEIDYESLTAMQVISFDSHHQGLKLLMFHRMVDSANPALVQFDFDLLLHRVQKFVLGSAVKIKQHKNDQNFIGQMMRPKEAHILKCFEYLRSCGVKELSLTQMHEIMMILRQDLHSTNQLLDHLELMIHFSTGLEKKAVTLMQLNAFLKQLKSTASHPQLKNYTVGHLVPLWQLAAFMTKWLLVEREIEDPFGDLDVIYKAELSQDEKEKFRQCWNGNLLQIVLELTEFALLHLQPGCNSLIENHLVQRGAANVHDDSLHTYLVDRDESKLRGVTIPDEILVKHVASAWHFAASNLVEDSN